MVGFVCFGAFCFAFSFVFIFCLKKVTVASEYIGQNKI